MASSLLALIDDIATLLDDVSLMTKVAAKKTAGVLGDDLALNAQQVTGVRADRELPVVWAVAKGSLKNKMILVPGAMLISAFIPWAITPLLMVGGAILCFEGFEKLVHTFGHKKDEDQAKRQARLEALANPAQDMKTFEKDKVKGAVRTDFILSAEIIAITLGTVAEATLIEQFAVLCGIAVVITAGVYGLVAAIVKLDDAGLYLSQREGEGAGMGLVRSFGNGILKTAPYLMKGLSIVGTIAMFLVGGGILTHGVPVAHHFVEHAGEVISASSGVAFLGSIAPSLMHGVIGVIAGAIVLAAVKLFGRIKHAVSA